MISQSRLLEEWAPGNTSAESFTKDPPNATISVFMKDGSGVKDAVVVLKNPKLEGDRLTFDVDVLEGDIAGGDGPASVFIDIIGRPFTPLSFAGVARRSAWRGAMYTGAAVAGAAAVGAAAYGAYGYHPYTRLTPLTIARPAATTHCLPAIEQKSSYRNSARQNFHVRGTIMTSQNRSRSSHPTRQFSCFALPIFHAPPSRRQCPCR